MRALLKHRSSSAAPTIVFDGETPRIATGAPRGSYVAPAVAQGIMNMIDFGMSPFEAVTAPRIMAVSNAIDISDHIRSSVSAEPTAAGYNVERSAQSFPFAALHAIGIVNGLCAGGADPQRDGMAISV